MTIASGHLEISRRFVRRAEDELQQGDSLQASEKAWGAAARALKAVAEQRGWGHGRHRDLFPVVERMIDETGQSELRLLFQSANVLHANFYEHWLSERMVRDGIGDVRQLLDILDPVV